MSTKVEDTASSPRIYARIGLVTVWAAAVLAAMAGLWAYKLTPGAAAEMRERWPADSRLAVGLDRPTLVMFAHPRCPCTRASLGELRAILSRFAGQMVTYVVFMQPRDSSADWSRTDTWATASSLAGVRVVTDIDGREAQLFGATTSGHVVLYDAERRLLFSGGITAARGHEGDSPQRARLAGLLERETTGKSIDPHLGGPGAVYGCPLGEKQP